MNSAEVDRWLKKFDAELPHFKDGRIDYSGAKVSLTICTIVFFEMEMLLMKRSERVNAYAGKWNGVSGFMDCDMPVEDKAREELEEEAGITDEAIQNISVEDILTIEDQELNRTWLMIPVIVELNRKPPIKLDWEHTKALWILPAQQLLDFPLANGYEQAVKLALNKRATKG